MSLTDSDSTERKDTISRIGGNQYNYDSEPGSEGHPDRSTKDAAVS